VTEHPGPGGSQLPAWAIGTDALLLRGAPGELGVARGDDLVEEVESVRHGRAAAGRAR
jgi:hypothetical protein